MFTDIIELREFYQSPRGLTAAGAIQRVLQPLWPTGQQLQAAVYGYAPPSMVPVPHTLALMPAQQGVAPWPHDSDNHAVLVDDNTLPLADQSLDVLLLMHALESAGNPQVLLRECWRVLKGNGRLLIVVPNRRGLWARAESTPFGRGSPYTATQLRLQLRQAQFMAERWQRTLFVPPFKSRTLLATAPLFHEVGSRLMPTFGGAIIMLATKQLYAPTGLLPAAKARLARPLVAQPTA